MGIGIDENVLEGRHPTSKEIFYLFRKAKEETGTEFDMIATPWVTKDGIMRANFSSDGFCWASIEMKI